jgi:hypothetical protein
MRRRSDSDPDDVPGPGFEDDQPREFPFGRGFDRPEPGRVLEHWHEPRYTQPYDRWAPHDYVFYSGEGYHREFIEPYKVPGTGRYSGRGPKGYVRSDVAIEEDVHVVLTQSPDIDGSDVRVRIRGGEVTLEGTVPDRAMKRAAEEAVEAVRGVRDVVNRLRVASVMPGREIPIETRVSASEPPADFGEIGGGSPPHYDRKAERES